VPAYEAVGLEPSANGGYDVHSANPLPLTVLVGRRPLPRTAYFDFQLGNGSPVPITVTGATVIHSGPAIAFARAQFLDGDGLSNPSAPAALTVTRGDPANVRVVIGLRACPAGSQGERSTVSAIRLRYTALFLPETTTVTPRYPLTLSCRS
jgi:hypothetical protein